MPRAGAAATRPPPTPAGGAGAAQRPWGRSEGLAAPLQRQRDKEPQGASESPEQEPSPAGKGWEVAEPTSSETDLGPWNRAGCGWDGADLGLCSGLEPGLTTQPRLRPAERCSHREPRALCSSPHPTPAHPTAGRREEGTQPGQPTPADQRDRELAVGGGPGGPGPLELTLVGSSCFHLHHLGFTSLSLRCFPLPYSYRCYYISIIKLFLFQPTRFLTCTFPILPAGSE